MSVFIVGPGSQAVLPKTWTLAVSQTQCKWNLWSFAWWSASLLFTVSHLLTMASTFCIWSDSDFMQSLHTWAISYVFVWLSVTTFNLLRERILFCFSELIEFQTASETESFLQKFIWNWVQVFCFLHVWR